MKKKLFKFLTLASFGLGSVFGIHAQYCGGGPLETVDTHIQSIQMAGVLSTELNIPNNCPEQLGVQNETAQSVSVVVGQTYTMTILRGYCTGNVYGHVGEIWIDFNEDFAYQASESVGNWSGVYDDNSIVNVTITIPGTVDPGNKRMRVSMQEGGVLPLNPCATFSYGNIIEFSVNVLALPDAPPAPEQAAGIPSCNLGTTLEITGTPDPDIEWYWQSDAEGTSMATPYAGPFTIFSNGTYYIRAYDSNIGLWSEPSSVVVSNFPTATDPPAPMAGANPACFNTDLTISTPPAGYEYYWQGTNNESFSNALSTNDPYPVTMTGTYYVAAYETATECWSNPVGTMVTISDVIPPNPFAEQTSYYACTGDASIEIGGDLSIYEEVSFTTTLAGGNGCDGGNMFNIEAGANDVIITAFDVIPNVGGAQNVTVHTKVGTYLGSEMNAGAWTTIGTYPINSAAGVANTIDIDDITIPAGEIYGIYVQFSAQYTTVGAGTTYSNADFTVIMGAGLCSPFGGVNPNRSFNGTIHYLAAAPADIVWFDASTGGNNLGSGLTLEAVGTSLLPTATEGTYEFHAFADLAGCYSTDSEIITVYVSNVNVELAAINAFCNASGTGSFSVDNIFCGVEPFSYSIDGGTFGAIPTNLTPGTYSVVVMDDNGEESGTYSITINDALPPSDLVYSIPSDEGGQFTWQSNALESSWYIEWGLPGFTPGTGNEIGADVTNTTSYTITGLSDNETYDVYVSANCGATEPIGEWTFLNFTTICSSVEALGWCENFDVSSTTKACWTVINANNDADAWDLNYAFNMYSGSNVAMLYTDFNNGNNDDWLITPQLTLTGNEIMSFFYRVQSSFEPNDFEVLLSTTGTNPSDFTETLMALASYDNVVYQDTAIDLSAYTGNVFIAFHVPPGGLDGWRLYIDQICVDVCIPAAGVDGATDACRLDNTIDLNSIITQGQSNGIWEFSPNPSIISGSDLNISALPSGTYQAHYLVTTACTTDTTVATINVYGASTAGNSGSAETCNYGPFNLFDGLTGTVDLGGTWYDPAGQPLNNAIVNFNGQIPANYNYYYITSNNVCPADTAFVEIQLRNCASISENELTGFALYPNPTSDVVNVHYAGSSINVDLVLVDTKGSVVFNQKVNLASDDTIEIDLSKLVKGVYFLNIYSEGGSKIIKVVKN